MDEQYELVSKSTLKELKDENERLKKELAQKPKEQIVQPQKNPEIEKTIKNLFSEFEEKQQKVLNKEFEEIKELNKSTLNNVLSNSQNLNTKLSGIIETMQHLVENLSTLLEEVTNNSTDNLEDQFKQLKKDLLAGKTSEDSTYHEEILTRLTEIETFMENLKVLLSQVKPADMSMNRNY